ncbi:MULTISPECIES: DUF5908 family protein [Serratia]|jgi:hypothetical protein|uniref:DUF5908 family protein n=1 Tax=Serratia TaxID=613 RepID=UPI000A8A1A8B|nr:MULTISPECIES: DUF5908 family protein [Serratia]CAI1560505.1 Uncharacterised protein [Serratia entomophila]
MTLEIRELVIEARVVNDAPQGGAPVARPGGTEDELVRWVELVTRRVLETLDEQRGRR